MIYRKERKSAAALSSLMAQTKDSMVCFEFAVPVDPTEPQETIDAKLRDANVVQASTPFARYFGFEQREDVLGKHLMDLFNNEVPSWFVDYGQEVEDREWDNIEREMWIPSPKGQRHIRVYMQNIFDGPLVTSQWLTIKDITRETRAEQALEENERIRQLAVDTIGLQTFTLNFPAQDSHGEMSLNDASVPAWFEKVHEDDRPQLEKAFKSFYEGGSTRLHSLFRIMSSTDEEHWYESWAIATERDEVGNPTVVSGVVLERTQTKAMEMQLIHNQRLESLGVMAGGIAHDFNNLLTSILGSVDLMRDTSTYSESDVSLIDDAAQQASQLCQQLLTYAGRGPAAAADTNLNEVVTNIHDLLGVSIDKDAQINFDLANENCVLSGDSSQLGQVVMNLVKNGSDALDGESGVITVATETKTFEPDWRQKYYLGQDLAAGEYVCLSVSDTGSGIEEQDLGRIFDPFYTTKFTGRGLGLAVVMGVVRSHNGGILVESNAGAGTRIEVVFPKLVEEVAQTPEPVQEAIPKLRGHILVVDDEVDIRNVAERLLKRLGVTATVVGSGREALAMIAENAYDGVLLDVTMPDLDGIETASRMLEQSAATQIVFSSGFSSTAIPEHLADRSRFLKKPYRLPDLHSCLSEFLPNAD